jgi:hypothetical protein
LDAGIQDRVEDFYSPKIKDDHMSGCWRRTSIAAGCLSDRPKKSDEGGSRPNLRPGKSDEGFCTRLISKSLLFGLRSLPGPRNRRQTPREGGLAKRGSALGAQLCLARCLQRLRLLRLKIPRVLLLVPDVLLLGMR